MTASEYFTLAATIYLAPHISNRSAWVIAVVLLIAAAICKVGEAA
ncbi:hypothetical protein [Variovorax sp. PAMC 28711]|nr:hypothetical protein [Variovorax sp. PAMC 28711]